MLACTLGQSILEVFAKLCWPEIGLIIFFYAKSQLARRTSYARAVAQTGDLATKKVISPISSPVTLKETSKNSKAS